ncbi:MAG: DUF6492 family protein [Candidatus Velthaea sp.]
MVTPSFSRDFTLCTELNGSVLEFFPESAKHYLIVDKRDLDMFRVLAGPRTIVAAVEDIIPSGYFKLPFLKRWWLSTAATVPVRGWLIQQLVKLATAETLEADVVVNVDSDVRFIRPVRESLFIQDGKTRLYRLPGGIVEGMGHVTWHHAICRLLGIAPDVLPMDDYVGNMISWSPRNVAALKERIERVTGKPWHVAFARGRTVSEYLAYGLFIEKVVGHDGAAVWLDERSWCHTYWGPGPLPADEWKSFVDAMPDDDVAFSIAGYTGTDREVVVQATQRAIQRATGVF